MSVSTNASSNNKEDVTSSSVLHRTTPLSQVSLLHPALSVSMVRQAIHAGKVPATRIGGRFYVDPAEVVQHLVTEA